MSNTAGLEMDSQVRLLFWKQGTQAAVPETRLHLLFWIRKRFAPSCRGSRKVCSAGTGAAVHERLSPFREA